MVEPYSPPTGRKRSPYQRTKKAPPTTKYRIEALRPRYRFWVQVDQAEDLDRALAKAVKLARISPHLKVRVWDFRGMKEVWSGKGSEAKIERWEKARPAGMTGRNPKLSRRFGNWIQLPSGIWVGRIDDPGWFSIITEAATYTTRLLDRPGTLRRYRLRVGPFRFKKDAEAQTAKMAREGYAQRYRGNPRTIHPSKLRGRARQNAGARCNPSRCANPNHGHRLNPREVHRQIVSAFLRGQPKRIGARYWTDGRLLRVWGNLVAEKMNGRVRLRDAGYQTVLTKNVLNEVLDQLKSNARIFQSKHRWYIGWPDGKAQWPGEWVMAWPRAYQNPRRMSRREVRGLVRQHGGRCNPRSRRNHAGLRAIMNAKDARLLERVR